MSSKEKTLNCSKIEALLGAYLEGDLPPEQAAAVQAHLDTCPACRGAAGGDTMLIRQLQREADWRRRRLSADAAARVQKNLYRRIKRALIVQRVTQHTGRLVAVVVLAAVVALLAWTPTGQTVAQAVGQFVRELRWPHTTVRQVPPDYEAEITAEDREWYEAQMAAGRGWRFSFEGHNFGGCCYNERVRDEAVSLSQAIAEAGFDLQLPTFLPEGYVLSQVRLLGVQPYEVFVIYESAERPLGLYQSFVGFSVVKRVGENVSVGVARASGISTDGPMEEMTVGETQAALLEGEFLTWEQDGISFSLIGPGLDAETLVRIAESLVPAR
jgi:hypothetical protein